jgi:FixJ family two-component response regulator
VNGHPPPPGGLERSDQPIVYVIDDDESMRRALTNLFQSVGLRVEAFGSAAELLQSSLPDVASCLVLDIRLPGLSGLDFQTELAKANIYIPIIFMTGHGDIPMTVKAMKAGATDFLTKPFRQQEMLDAVAAAIEHDRKRRKDEKTISNARVPFIFIAAGADDTVRARALSSGERARHDFRLRARPAAALDRWRQHLITRSARRRPASRTGIRRPFRRQSERMRHHQRLKLQGVWAHQTF